MMQSRNGRVGRKQQKMNLSRSKTKTDICLRQVGRAAFYHEQHHQSSNRRTTNWNTPNVATPRSEENKGDSNSKPMRNQGKQSKHKKMKKMKKKMKKNTKDQKNNCPN